MVERIGEPKPTLYICHFGLNRSVAIVRAMNDKGVRADYFKGGTSRMRTMNTRDIKKEVRSYSVVVLIYDPAESTRAEFEDKQVAVDKLASIGVRPIMMSNSQLATTLHEQGQNVNDYML